MAAERSRISAPRVICIATSKPQGDTTESMKEGEKKERERERKRESGESGKMEVSRALRRKREEGRG